MGVLQGFLSKTDQNGTSSEPLARPFSELDVEKIKKDFNLIEEGQKRGEKNLPQSASTTLDDIEHKIITFIEMEQRQQHQSLNSQLNGIQQCIAGMDIEHEAININGVAQRTATELSLKVDDGKAKLFTLWRNVCLIEQQWQDFRKTNNLTHPADYPLSRLWNFAVILAILAIESVLNGNFLARGLETGLIGGIIEAFIIAAINVMFGVFLGNFVLRYAFHKNMALRILAFIEIPVSFIIAMFFNLLVGHYRDALGGPDPVHASAIALGTFTLNPFFLSSLQSWILFAMGLFFFSIATFDGFKMDDPYPGYGKISRKHEEITQDYTNEKANIVDDLSYTCEKALDSIRKARQNLAERKGELVNALSQREKLVHMFETHQAYLNRIANDLLSTYRNANINIRTTPAPVHFNNNYSLPPITSLTNSMDIAALDANVDKADTALKNAINQINTQFEDAIGSFHQIGELTSESDNGTRTPTEPR